MQIENKDVVEEVITVPSSEDNHLGAIHKVSGVIETGSGCTTTFWSLEPSHGERVKCMQVSEDSLGSLTTEDNDSSSSKDGSVAVSGRRRGTRDARLDPTRGVYIKHMSIIQVGEAVSLAFVVMTAKDDE